MINKEIKSCYISNEMLLYNNVNSNSLFIILRVGHIGGRINVPKVCEYYIQLLGQTVPQIRVTPIVTFLINFVALKIQIRLYVIMMVYILIS